MDSILNWKGIPQMAVAAIVGMVATVFVINHRESRRTADPAALLREIQALNELISVRYRIQKVVSLVEAKAPVGSERLLLIVQADALAGVDLSSMTGENVQRRDNMVSLRLPPARILHIVTDESRTRVWDRQITWWTPWVPYNNDLERQARLAAIESVKDTAIEMGILTEAKNNAERNIRQLLRTLGLEAAGLS